MTFSILHTEASCGRGGQEMRTVTEARAFLDMGHRVLIAGQPASGIESLAQGRGVPFVRLPMRGTFDLLAMQRLTRLARRQGIQILHTHSSVDSWIGGLVGRYLRLPLVVRTRHISFPIGARFAYRRLVDLIITTGEATRQALIRQHRLAPHRVFSVPTGVDLTAFDPAKYDQEQARAALGVPGQVPVIGIVGIIRWWKGHDVFLEAARLVLQQCPEARFLVVGDGPNGEHTYAETIDRRGLQGKVAYLGFRTDVPVVLTAMDILVSASVAGEGVSQAIVQALAMKRAVVATRVGSTEEVIQHRQTGLLVQPHDAAGLAEAIVGLILDHQAARAYGEAGCRLVREGFDVQQMARKLEALYRGFLYGKPLAGP